MPSVREDPFVPGERIGVAPTGEGPLSGLNFAVKDVLDVAGRPTGLGLACAAPPAERTAAVVEACLAAGAELVGKTITDELAYSLFGENQAYGSPLNPAAPHRVPGGSSSGSASAVAQGLVDFALGTDTAGSIRVPASFCGLFGLRTTQGAVASAGLHHLARSFDTIGWLTGSAALLRRVTAALLAQPARRPFEAAVLCEWAFAEHEAGPDLRTQALAWAEARGLRIERQDEPAADLGQVREAFRTIQSFEAFAENGHRLADLGERLPPDIVARLRAGQGVSRAAYEAARSWRRGFADQVNSRLGEATLLLLPSAPPPPPLGQVGVERETARASILGLTCLAGMAGAPQLTAPAVSTWEGPVGLGVIGPRGSDLALASLAAMPGEWPA